MRRVAMVIGCAATLAALLAGCRADSSGGLPAVSRPAARKPGGAAEADPKRAAPLSRMAVLSKGSDSEAGALAAWCSDGRCVTNQARPVRPLAAPPGVAVAFTVSKAPSAARVQVRREGERGAVAQVLNPGTLMAYRAPVTVGAYVVTLTVEWRDASARWLYQLEVREDGT